jgi:hypothetical protein
LKSVSVIKNFIIKKDNLGRKSPKIATIFLNYLKSKNTKEYN